MIPLAVGVVAETTARDFHSYVVRIRREERRARRRREAPTVALSTIFCSARIMRINLLNNHRVVKLWFIRWRDLPVDHLVSNEMMMMLVAAVRRQLVLLLIALICSQWSQLKVEHENARNEALPWKYGFNMAPTELEAAAVRTAASSSSSP
jgi:hypothetical protein